MPMHRLACPKIMGRVVMSSYMGFQFVYFFSSDQPYSTNLDHIGFQSRASRDFKRKKGNRI